MTSEPGSSLQWGRDQVIAEGRMSPVFFSTFLVALQWGRDQVIAEGSSLSRTYALNTTLQWGRDQVIAEGLLGVPSRRPQHQLQWGRDQVIAEGGSGDIYWRIKVGLQWGRDQVIAEDWLDEECPADIYTASMGPRSSDRGRARRPIHSSVRYGRFNGAAIK